MQCFIGKSLDYWLVQGNISYAMDIAEQIEFVANIYYNTLLAGGPKMLKDEDIDVVLEAFKTYRQR